MRYSAVMNKTGHITVQDILSAVQYRISNADKMIIERACAYAQEKHAGQKRYSGLPYYTHTFEVGKLLAEYNMPVNVIAAGILHDTLEDTDTHEEDLRRDFNDEIAFFVESVSNLGEVRYRGLDVRIKSLQKLFVATSKDVRVIIIKLMDRLHNMRTIDSVPKEKQKRISKETQRVYVPIADRLGMGTIKKEMEDLAFKNIDPKNYREVKKKIDEWIGTISIQNIERKVSSLLSKTGVKHFETSSRIKSVYSTHMKMGFKKYTFEQINDIIALRIVVRDTGTAYNILGIIHANWYPIPGTFKDYISLPKPNGYQALHTRIIIDKHILEIQILTHAMYRHAQIGIAAHFNYKEKRAGIAGIEEKWFNKLLSPHGMHAMPRQEQNLSPSEKKKAMRNFAEDVEADFLQERMFVFTPKGEVVDLPVLATVVDFAFAIHSDIGIHAEGALVNGTYTSLKHELKNGDIVNVKTAKKPTVTKKWLDWVKTAEARSRIRRFIKKNS